MLVLQTTTSYKRPSMQLNVLTTSGHAQRLTYVECLDEEGCHFAFPQTLHGRLRPEHALTDAVDQHL